MLSWLVCYQEESVTWHHACLPCRRSTRLASKRGSDSSSHSLESSRASATSDPGEHTDTETRVRSDALSGKYPEESLLCWSFVPNYYSLMGHCHIVYHHVPLPIHFSVLSALKERLEEFPAISTSQSEYTHTYIHPAHQHNPPTHTATQHNTPTQPPTHTSTTHLHTKPPSTPSQHTYTAP